MTPTAAHGGQSAAKAQPGTPLAEATITKVYLDHLSRQWRCSVRLDGGRTIGDVRFIYPSSRLTAGDRPILPAVNERGIVGWPSSSRQVRDCYWLGSIDIYTYGPDVSHSDEALYVHPSGQAQLTDRYGNYCWRYPNEDRLYLDGAELNLDEDTAEESRSIRIKHRQHPSGQASLKDSVGKYPEADSRHFYDGRKSGVLYGAKLAKGEKKGDFYINNLAQYCSIKQNTGSKTVSFYGSTKDEAHWKWAASSGRNSASATLEADHKLKLESTVSGITSSLTLSAEDQLVELVAQRVIKLLSQQSIELSAPQAITAKSAVINLKAPITKAGTGAVKPVAMADVVDRNFLKITMMLGLPFEPTLSKSLMAEGLL